MQAIPGSVGIARSRRERILASVGIWLTVLSTIALLPGAMDRWVLPKVAIAVLGCLLASFAPRTGRVPVWAAVLIGAGAVLLIVAALLGAEPGAQLLGRWPRYEGLVTLPAYVAAFWTGALTLGPASSVDRYHAVYSSIAVASISIGVISVLESTGLRPIASTLARPGSLLGNASDEGAVGLMCFAVLLVGAIGRAGSDTRGVRRWLTLGGAAFGVATVVLSESRTDIAALLVVCVLAIVTVIAFYRDRPGWRVTLAALITVIAGSIALAGALPGVRGRLFHGGSPLDVFGNDRGSLWGETARMIARHPLFGVGPSGFVDALPAYTTRTWFASTGLGVTTDSPHSGVLQAAVAGGLPLALVAIALAVLVIARGMRSVKTDDEPGVRRELVLGSLMALVGFGVALLATFTSPATTILAAFLAGIVVSQTPRAKAPAGRRVVRLVVARGVLLSLWSAAIILTTVAEIPLQSATADASAGDVPGALTQFAAARALRPWDVDITLIEAQSLTAAAARSIPGAASAALRWSRAAHDAVPDSVLGAKSLAAAQQLNGELAAAIATVAALNERAPNDPETLARLGFLYADRGLFARARPVLERVVSISPRDTASLAELGFVYRQLGDFAGVAKVTAALAKLGAN